MPCLQCHKHCQMYKRIRIYHQPILEYSISNSAGFASLFYTILGTKTFRLSISFIYNIVCSDTILELSKDYKNQVQNRSSKFASSSMNPRDGFRGAKKISDCWKDRDEELSFFRDIQKRGKEQVSLLQHVSDEFDANGKYLDFGPLINKNRFQCSNFSSCNNIQYCGSASCQQCNASRWHFSGKKKKLNSTKEEIFLN